MGKRLNRERGERHAKVSLGARFGGRLREPIARVWSVQTMERHSEAGWRLRTRLDKAGPGARHGDRNNAG